MDKAYIEHEGKVVHGGNFKHVMAITINPLDHTEGVIRCIKSRSGDLAFKGNVDKSELYKVNGESLEHFEMLERLQIKNEQDVINKLTPEDYECIGLEDPDLWLDKETNLLHLYFTIPIIPNKKESNGSEKGQVHLGHAVGKDLDSLEMTDPVLMDNGSSRAKEVSIAPLNTKGFRYNLIESKDRTNDISYSVVQVAIAEDMGRSWKYGDIVFHPKEHNMTWIAGHASPGPLFSKNFIDIGEGKLLGLINGCEESEKIGDKVKYGNFSIGLFIYDYEQGKIDWVSPEPFIEDSEAGKDGGRAITFASQFIETGNGEGILYAHVDDSFVRAYTLNADKIRSILPLPKKFE